jgi:hypothetical protein
MVSVEENEVIGWKVAKMACHLLARIQQCFHVEFVPEST